MGTRISIAAALILLAATAALSARSDPEKECRKAAALVEEGKFEEGGKLFAEILAPLQKKGDLLGEQQAAAALFAAFDNADKAGRADGHEAPLLLALLAELDPKRNGAFVSAPALAGRLLLLSTESGDRTHVETAEKVLKTFARQKKSGTGAAALAAYGDGLVSLAKGEKEAAAAALNEAFSVMVEHGWWDLAVHAGVELAAAELSLEKPRAATDALKRIDGLFPEKGDVTFANMLSALVKVHLAGAPAEVLAPATRAIGRHGGVGRAGASGGRGGAGGQAGGGDISEVGKAFPRLPKKQPFVIARRKGHEFEIRHVFDRDFEDTMPWCTMVKHQDSGGITLSFWCGAVALAQVDLEGLQGQPGERTVASPLTAFTYLADGETWGVSKTGVVTVESK
jgi:hypothetical protein